MKQLRKKILCILCCICICMSVFPVSIGAAEETETKTIWSTDFETVTNDDVKQMFNADSLPISVAEIDGNHVMYFDGNEGDLQWSPNSYLNSDYLAFEYRFKPTGDMPNSDIMRITSSNTMVAGLFEYNKDLSGFLYRTGNIQKLGKTVDSSKWTRVRVELKNIGSSDNAQKKFIYTAWTCNDDGSETQLFTTGEQRLFQPDAYDVSSIKITPKGKMYFDDFKITTNQIKGPYLAFSEDMENTDLDAIKTIFNSDSMPDLALTTVDENKVLEVTEADVNSVLQLSFDPALTGKKLVVEYKFKPVNSMPASDLMIIQSTDGKKPTQLEYSGKFFYRSLSTGSGGAVGLGVSVDPKKWTKLHLEIDDISGTSSVFNYSAVSISDDGTEQTLFSIEDKKFLETAANDFSLLQIKPKGKIYIDDVKVMSSNTEEINSEKYGFLNDRLTASLLTDEKPYKITKDLFLPAKGVFGTTISWTSTNPNIINPDNGAINRQTEDTDVTLKAVMTWNDNLAAEKEFLFLVKASDADDNENKRAKWSIGENSKVIIVGNEEAVEATLYKAVYDDDGVMKSVSVQELSLDNTPEEIETEAGERLFIWTRNNNTPLAESYKVMPDTVIYICGDKTCAVWDDDQDIQGWGYYITSLIDNNAEAVNVSATVDSQTAKDFKNSAAYSELMENAKSGDWILISFGIKDSLTDSADEYGEAVGSMLADAKNKGINAAVVIQPYEKNADYSAFAVKAMECAKSAGVLCVDLNSVHFSNTYYADDTSYNCGGAEFMANAIADYVKKAGSDIKYYFK